MRVAVLDIGSNSTRLLLADVDAAAAAVHELARRSVVTRLGHGVERTGVLDDAAMERVLAALTGYDEIIAQAGGAERRIAVLTSAVRDASNGPAFTKRVAAEHQLEAQAIPGELEAQLSYLGATSGRPQRDETLVVVDIGGGSTEFVVGRGGEVLFHTTTQAGVVRHTERHIHHDPPLGTEVDALATDVREIYAAAVPADLRAQVTHMVAVAGTATSMSAIDQRLDPYDPERVHGSTVTLATCERLCDELALRTDAERRTVPGLHPDRAPTIVAGAALLIEAMLAFGLEEFEVSEHDILYGVALRAAGSPSPLNGP
jgi:exopolyphosphatase/guanosine-5'-triphosphate,3'-diphosphate pyrophosphatase